jgi:hypothetical protein
MMQVKISDQSTTLENLDDNAQWAWENITENIRTSAKDSLRHY